MAVLQTKLIMSLVDRVTAPARGVQATVDRLNARIRKNDQALAGARAGVLDAVGAYYSLKAAIGAPVQEAAAFESAMADVRKVVDFPTPKAFTDFQQGLMDLSKEVPLTVNGLAEIAAAAGQAGIAGGDLNRFTETAAKIGTAFDITADDAGTALAKLMTGLDMNIEQVTLLADSMNHLSNAQASGADEILDVVRRAGAQGKQFGFSAEQTAAFASAMISAGAESEVAATSFMNMGRALTRGASATKRQRNAFEKLGLDHETIAKRMQEDAAGTTVAVMEAIATLPAEMRAAVSSDIFGDEARALGPLLTNLGLVRDSLEMVGDESDYAGSAFKEFEVRNKTFGNKLKIFNNRLTAVKITIGNSLLPILSSLMDRMAPIIEQIGDWIEMNPRLTGGIISAAAGLVAFRGALAAIRFVGLLGKGGALSLLAAGMNTVGRAGGYLGTAARESVRLNAALAAMDGTKVGLIGRLGAALRGLAAATGLSAVATAVSGVAGAIAAISAPVWLGVAAAVFAVGAAWKYWDRISAIVTGVGQAISIVLKPAMEWAKSNIPGITPVIDGMSAAFRKVGDAVNWMVGKVRAIGSSLFSREILTEAESAAISARAQQLVTNIISKIGQLPALIAAEAERLYTAGLAMIQRLWDGMTEKADQVVTWARKKAAEISAAMTPEFNWRAGVNQLVGSNLQRPAEQAKAVGGHMRAGIPTMVGEQGREMIFPTRSGWVAHAAQVKRLTEAARRVRPAAMPRSASSGGGGSRPISLSFGDIVVQGGANASAQDISREIGRSVSAELRSVFADAV